MNRLARPRSLAMLGSVGALLLAAGLLAACGGSSSASSSTVSAQSTGAAGSGAGRGGFGGTPPGAFGVLAEITGNSLEVQNQATGQVTVTFTASTAFSQTKSVPLAALKVGDCVTAVAVRAQTSSSPSAPSSPTGPLTNFIASSVQISAPVNGSCELTGFGGGRTRPSGSRTPQPGNSSFPRPIGTRGNFGGGFGGFGLATGTVTQLSGDTMFVRTTARGQQASTLDTVTLTDATTFTEDAKVSSSALKLGECVTATGSTNSTGAVAATKIALSTAGPNGCSSGFGGRPRPGASTSGA